MGEQLEGDIGGIQAWKDQNIRGLLELGVGELDLSCKRVKRGIGLQFAVDLNLLREPE